MGLAVWLWKYQWVALRIFIVLFLELKGLKLRVKSSNDDWQEVQYVGFRVAKGCTVVYGSVFVGVTSVI